MKAPEPKTARDVLNAYLLQKGLKRSGQREVILEALEKSKKHLSVDDIFAVVHNRHPDIGRATVYRTVKVLQDAGLVSELALEGRSRFEIEWKREHHDHFICESCGSIFEFVNPEIERLQDESAAEIDFAITRHKHQIFGLCKDCRRNPPKRKVRA